MWSMPLAATIPRARGAPGSLIGAPALYRGLYAQAHSFHWCGRIVRLLSGLAKIYPPPKVQPGSLIRPPLRANQTTLFAGLLGLGPHLRGLRPFLFRPIRPGAVYY